MIYLFGYKWSKEQLGASPELHRETSIICWDLGRHNKGYYGNTLRHYEFKSCRAPEVFLLEPEHVQNHLKFSKDHLNDPEEARKKVMGSDETKRNSGRNVWRRKKCRLTVHGSENFMVWGRFPPKDREQMRSERLNGSMFGQILDQNLLSSVRWKEVLVQGSGGF